MHSPLRRLTAFVEERKDCVDDIDIGMPWKQFDLTLGDLRALLAELEWRPIATFAGKDCDDVMVWWNGQFYKASWIEGFTVEGHAYPTGWYRGWDQAPINPTHWRPLPQPPSREGEK